MFQGTAMIDGVAATDGTVITPWVYGNQVTLMNGVVSGGVYVIKVLQPTGSAFEGKVISFKIGPFFANETSLYSVGEVFEVDLTATSTLSMTTAGGITIDGIGMFSDSDSAGCGYGKVVR